MLFGPGGISAKHIRNVVVDRCLSALHHTTLYTTAENLREFLIHITRRDQEGLPKMRVTFFHMLMDDVIFFVIYLLPVPVHSATRFFAPEKQTEDLELVPSTH